MICLATSHRPATRTRVGLPLLTLALLGVLAACTDTAAEDDGDGETGDSADTGEALACIDPGSELLPEAAAVEVPTDVSSITCASGWATDAPTRSADWTVQLGEVSEELYFAPVYMEGHPEGGVVMIATGSFSRYDAAGDPLWSNDLAMTGQQQFALTVEEAGTIVRSIYDWNNETVTIERFDADGNLVEPITVMWNSIYPSVWGLESFGSDLIIGAFDEDADGFYENTLIRLDAAGNQLLRKSTNMANGQILAVSDAGTVMFGTSPGFLVSLENGAVLGTLSPSTGFPSTVVGGSADFFMAGGGSGDLVLGRYSGVGTERWLQAYDRAGLGEQSQAVDVGADGTIVVGGTTQALDFIGGSWFGTQPLVIAADADGNALWTDRMAAYGNVAAVAVSDGVYVAGMAETEAVAGQEPGLLYWLRRYSL
jgi:hypothetical protein